MLTDFLQMGAPPNEDQMADLLSNPAIAQTMNEALNNPAFVDQMIQANPMLANMPNAREMIQSPYFRNMMTNPEALRMAARMRRVMGGGGPGQSAFPAPGVTDTTPAGAPSSTDDAPGSNAADRAPGDMANFGGFGGAGGENPFAALFGAGNPFGAGSPFGAGNPFAPPPAAGQTQNAGNAAATPASSGTTAPAQQEGQQGAVAQAQANPFAALFQGAGQGAGQGALGANPANGSNPFGLPPMSPEAWQQALQMMGMPGGPQPASSPDNRPPEDRYAEQLRQLNALGFTDFEQIVAALRRSGGSVNGAIEHLLGGA
jgi:ubiquilin